MLDEFMLALFCAAGPAGVPGGGGGGGGGGQPTLGAVSVASLDSGSCDPTTHQIATEARLRISWSIANADNVNYQLKVYENGVLMASGTLSCSTTSFDKTVIGAVEDGIDGSAGHGSQWTSNWTYRVDLVRISDSVAVQTQTASAWVQNYNVCSGTGGGG